MALSLVCFCLAPLSQTYHIRLSSITVVNRQQNYRISSQGASKEQKLLHVNKVYSTIMFQRCGTHQNEM